MKNKFLNKLIIGKDPTYLPFFRITIGLVAIVDFITMGGDFKLFFSEESTILPQELSYLFTEYFGILNSFYQYLESIGLITSFYNNIGWIYIVILVCLILGLFTRFTALLAIILQLIIFKSFALFNFGYDHFLTISLFYCFIFPVGKFLSLDNKIFKREAKLKYNFNYQNMLRIHLSIVYFFAGIAKIVSVTWWNGEAVWRSISSIYDNLFQIPPAILATVGIITVLMEISYPFIMLHKKARKVLLMMIISMHLGIAFMLQLPMFAAIMIVWNLTAYFKDVFNFNINTIQKKTELAEI